MDVVHSKRSIPARELQLMVLAGQYGISGTVVSSDNPFNPFGADVGIDYWFQDTGIFSSYTQNHQRLSVGAKGDLGSWRSEEHTSELQSLMRISYAVFCLKKKKQVHTNTSNEYNIPHHNS